MRSLTRPAVLRAAFGSAALFATLGIGCAHSAPPASPADTWKPSAEEDAMYNAFSMRDNTTDCATIEALAKDPVATLISTVEHSAQPPWVAVRATHCLASRHAAEAQTTLSAWAIDPAKRGLAILILDELNTMPEPIALQLATATLAGPHAADARKRLPKSVHPSVRALVPAAVEASPTAP